jgi:hypothetical protein
LSSSLLTVVVNDRYEGAIVAIYPFNVAFSNLRKRRYRAILYWQLCFTKQGKENCST